jgi:hypothetical protein
VVQITGPCCFAIEIKPSTTRKNFMNLQQEIRDILQTSEVNGGKHWSRKDGDIHAPHGYSTIDVLMTLGEIGHHYKDSQITSDAVNFIFEYLDDNGCFKYSPKSSKLPCITARILSALGRLGYETDDRIEKCYLYLFNSQQNDGGWRCSTVKLGKVPETDASNPGTTLYVLDAFRFRSNSKNERVKLENGLEFLLKHWDTRKPLGPCGFGIGSRFLQIEYPFLRYNIFYYVYVLSKYDKIRNDKRFKEAKKSLLDKTKDGKIFPETPHKFWNNYSFAKKNELSELATKRYFEI